MHTNCPSDQIVLDNLRLSDTIHQRGEIVVAYIMTNLDFFFLDYDSLSICNRLHFHGYHPIFVNWIGQWTLVHTKTKFCI